jgi:pimeloyl-ACP methyl ester carboxylesterase
VPQDTGRSGIVLVHGSGNDSRIWDLVVAELARVRPDVPVLAVDLPGRGTHPGPFARSVEETARSVVDDIARAGLHDVLLVGHSMAGITVPQVASVLGADRTRGMVFIACAVPRDGERILDLIPWPLRVISSLTSRRTKPVSPPPLMVNRVVCNGMSDELANQVRHRNVPEAPWMTALPVDRSMTPQVPVTWIMTTRDRLASAATQLKGLRNLGGGRIVEIDAPHAVLFSHPVEVAAVLLDAFDYSRRST